jgi:protein-tyrosine phosphatase
MTVLFVCSGNTCRSPMAEAVFNHCAQKLGLGGELTAFSAGLFASEGMPASIGSISAVSALGIDLTPHRATQFTLERGARADLILCMERAHLYRMKAMDEKLNANTLIYYALGTDEDIADPFGGTYEEYKRTLAQIQKAVVAAIARLSDTDPEALLKKLEH